MLLIRKTEWLFDAYDRIVFTKPTYKSPAISLSWFHPLCRIMYSYFGLCCVFREIGEANYKEIHTVTGRLEFRKFSSHKLYSDSASFLLWASEAGKFANSTSRRLKVQFRFVVFLDFAFDHEFVRCMASCAFSLRIFRIRPDSERAGTFSNLALTGHSACEWNRNRYICESRSCEAHYLLSSYWTIFLLFCISGYLAQSAPSALDRWPKMISWWEPRIKSIT